MAFRDAVPPFPERFNLCDDFLDRNLREGRGRKVALLEGDRSRTYEQVSERARRVAAALRRAGVRPEERVLIVLPDVMEFADAWFGTLRAGGVFAMVNPLLHREAYAEYLDYTKARVVITHTDVLPEIGPAIRASRLCRAAFVVGPDAGGFTAFEDALRAEDPGSNLAEMEPTGPDDLAGWLFTSGSTGTPKACVHVHADFAFNAEVYAGEVVGYCADDVCLSVPKLFFGYATGTNLMFPFRFGGSSVLFPERATADVLFDHIARFRPTLLTSVPTMINAMLRSPRMESADLSSLRVCLSAGEALPPALYSEWKQRTNVEILDGIGSAEMFHIYVTSRFGDVTPGSLGRLVRGYEADIVGPDGRLVPVGEPGRMRIRGGSTAICYWGDREKSAATFQGDTCTTADIFRRDAAGRFWYEGRDDDLLKVSGIWVSPLEIENCLLEHPAVAEVCVVGAEDEQKLVKPLAFVVLQAGWKGGEETAASLKAHAKARIAPHKYPRWFEWRESLPKNDRGKVARKVLKGEVDARTKV
ncbi:MAG: benzoate-CoA ligase family protein [Planctomycetota bacterium]|nr:benzoate-CoA ligase family protein [Planctomycetota bacterium]